MIDLTQPLDSNVPVYPGDPPFSCQQSSAIPRDGFSVHALSCSSHTGTHIDAPSHFFIDGTTVDQLPLSAFILPALVLDVSHKKARESIVWDDVEPMAHRIRPNTAVLFHTGWSQYWDRSTTAPPTAAHSTASSDSIPKSGRQRHHYFDHPWLATDVAGRLLALGVRLVGIDTMSPDQSPSPSPSSPPSLSPIVTSAAVPGSSSVETGTDGEEPACDFGVHTAVLGAGGLIVENLTNLDTLLIAQDAAGADAEVIISALPLKITGCDGSPVRAVAWLQSRGSFSRPV
jgi:kynurenine formamidase